MSVTITSLPDVPKQLLSDPEEEIRELVSREDGTLGVNTN